MGKLNTAYALGAMIGSAKFLIDPDMPNEMADWQRERLRKIIEEIDRRGVSQFADDADSSTL